MKLLLENWKNFVSSLSEAKGDNYKVALDYLRQKEYDIEEQPPGVLTVKTPDRAATKAEIESDLTALGYIFNDLAPGSSFGRFELLDRENGSVYIYLKPNKSGAAGAGADYEKQVADSMARLLPNLDVKTAGFGHGSDLTIKSGNEELKKELKMELKTSSGADFGQFKLAYDLTNNTWVTIKTDKFVDSADLFQGIFDTVVAPALKDKIIKNIKDPAFNIKDNAIVGLNRSANTAIIKHQLQKELFGDKSDLILSVDGQLIQYYYSKKGDSLISIEGRGVYALTKKAASFFKVPELATQIKSARIRFRIKPHMGDTGVHSFTCALKLLLTGSGTKVTDQKFLDKVTQYFNGVTLEEMIKQELVKVLQEAWSKSERSKRKSKCSNPKGFTMKQFCKNQRTRSKAGERKN